MKKTLTAFLLASAFAALGFAQEAPSTNIIMRVNGQNLTRGLLDRERAGLAKAMPDASEILVMKTAVSNLIQRVALNQAVEKDQITVTNDEVAEQVRETKGLLPDNMSFNGFLAQRGMDKGQFRQQLASTIKVNKFFQKRVPPYEPSAADIGKYFRENKDKFFIPAAVDVQHFKILVDENDTGDTITKKRNQMTRYLEQIQKGESFDALATLFSEGPRASEGGRLGMLGREAFSDELRGEVFKLKEAGAFTEILTSKQGLHFFKMLGHREAVPLRLDQSQEHIRGFLKRRHQQVERDRILKNLVVAAKVERL